MQQKFIDEIIQKSNIVDLVSKYVKLHKKGANFFGLCPFHPDSHPSMSVNGKKGIFKCFSCGASGNAITFIQKYKKISFIEALTEIARSCGFSESEIDNNLKKDYGKNSSLKFLKLYNLNSAANDIFKNLLYIDENKNILDHLLNHRKISNETIKQFQLGFSSKNNCKDMLFNLLTNNNNLLGNINENQFWTSNDLLQISLINVSPDAKSIMDFFYNRITFPIYDSNSFLVGFIGRTVEKNQEVKYLLSNSNPIFNKSNILYNYVLAKQENAKTIILLEGNLDVISIYEAKNNETIKRIGDYHAIGLMGTALTNEHIKLLKNDKNIKNIILWFDNDDAGKKASLINGFKLLQENLNVFIIENNTKFKDVNDILIEYGKDKINEMILSNIDFISYYIKEKISSANEFNKIELTEEILKIISKYGNSLLREKHLKLLSNYTSFPINDIELKFNEFSSNKSIATPKKINKNNYINYYQKKLIENNNINNISIEDINAEKKIVNKINGIDYSQEIIMNIKSSNACLYILFLESIIFPEQAQFILRKINRQYIKNPLGLEIINAIKQIVFNKEISNEKNIYNRYLIIKNKLPNFSIELNDSIIKEKNIKELDNDKNEDYIKNLNNFLYKCEYFTKLNELNFLDTNSKEYKIIQTQVEGIKKFISHKK